MKFLQKKWPFWVNGLLLMFMVLLGLYLFNDILGFSNVFQALFGYAESALKQGGMPEIEWSWQIGMLAGVLLGASGGSMIHGSWKLCGALEGAKNFAGKTVKTAFTGIFSGFLVMLGSIAAGEAFYGQFAAALELSGGAWFFLVAALTSGGITALFIERSSNTAAGSKNEKKETAK